MLGILSNNPANIAPVEKYFYKNKPKECNSSNKNNRPLKPKKKSIQETRL